MQVDALAHNSPLFWKTVDLRREVLRLPLNLDFDAEDLARESDQLHIAVVEKEQVLACAVLKWTEPGVATMRQVAVRPDLQGKGVGRVLVDGFERIARENGATEIVMNARDTAVPFYLRLGYATIGKPFEEVGIPHHKMRKSLAKSI